MSGFKEVNKKIEEAVVGSYKKIEDTVVSAYKSIEEGVVDKYKSIEDAFVDKFLTEEGESTEEAKKRLLGEQEEK